MNLGLGLLGQSIQYLMSQKVYEELLGQKINYRLFDFQYKNILKDLNGCFDQEIVVLGDGAMSDVVNRC